MFIHLSIHSFNKYSQGASFVPGTVLGTKDTAMNKTDKVLIFMELILWLRETDHNHINTIYKVVASAMKINETKRRGK